MDILFVLLGIELSIRFFGYLNSPTQQPDWDKKRSSEVAKMPKQR